MLVKIKENKHKTIEAVNGYATVTSLQLLADEILLFQVPSVPCISPTNSILIQAIDPLMNECRVIPYQGDPEFNNYDNIIIQAHTPKLIALRDLSLNKILQGDWLPEFILIFEDALSQKQKFDSHHVSCCFQIFSSL